MKGSLVWRFPMTALLGLVVCGGLAQRSDALCKPADEDTMASFLGSAVINTYLRSPRSLLGAYKHDLSNLSLVVRQIAVRGAQPTSDVIAIVPFADDMEREAIARGLKMAADICQSRDVAIARAIQTAAKKSSNRVIRQAFDKAADDPLPEPQKPAGSINGAGFGVSQAKKSLLSPDGKGFDLPDPFAPVSNEN